MSLKENNSEKNLSGTGDLGSLSRQQLKELEAREKNGFQKALDWIIMILPVRRNHEQESTNLSRCIDCTYCGIYHLFFGRMD